MLSTSSVLYRAGFSGRKVVVPLDMTGSVVGYLLSVEPKDVLLLAASRRPSPAEDEPDTVVWNLAVVPRTYPMIVGHETIYEESEEVRALWDAYGGRSFSQYCQQKAGLPPDTDPAAIL